MFCKYCGSKLNDNARFCRNCGKKVENDYPKEEYTHNYNSSQTQIATERLKVPIVIVTLICAFCNCISFLKVYEVDDWFDIGLGSFSFSDIIKTAFKIKSYMDSDSFFPILLAAFIIYLCFIVGLVLLFKAFMNIINGELSDYTLRAYTISYINICSITTLIQEGVLLVISLLTKDTLSCNSMFWICFAASVVSLIYSSVLDDNNKNTYESKSDSTLKRRKNDSWVCNCGTRNSNAQKYCSNCSKPKS